VYRLGYLTISRLGQVTALLLASHTLRAQAPAKKLIAIGGGPPTAEYIRSHIGAMEQEPFDGVVLQFKYEDRPFRHRQLDTLQFAGDISDLKAIRFNRFTDNFVLVKTTADSGWDWFDDAHWKATEANIRLFARAAKAGGLAGLALDYEAYGFNPWSYSEAPRHDSMTFEQYSQEVRRRGQSFIRAIQGEFPAVRIIAFYQLSYFAPIAGIADSARRAERLASNPHGLLVPFLNGILEAIDSSVTIIDGNETGSYYYAKQEAFRVGAMSIREGALPLVESELRPIYASQVQVGQAVFLDYVLGVYHHGRDSANLSLTPSQELMWLMNNTYYALKTSDRYAWLYYEKVNIWTDSVPSGVFSAIAGARLRLSNGEALGFDIDSVLHSPAAGP